MTREEVKHWLEIELGMWEDECKSEHPIKEALSVVIKALEQEPCEDTISRQAAIDAMDHMCSEDEHGITVSRANVNSMLKALPHVTPQEPKTGHWIDVSVLYSRCSECGKDAIIANWSKVLSNFCPNCGAKMIEPQESEDKK